MNRSTVANRANLDLIEEHYRRWQADPESVDEGWRLFFEGFELGSTRAEGTAGGEVDLGAARAQAGVTRLIDAYREIGHYLADLDPLKMTPVPETLEFLELSQFGLTAEDLDRTFYAVLVPTGSATLREIIAILRQTYCGSVGVEYMHIRN